MQLLTRTGTISPRFLQPAIEYLRAENRVLRAALGPKRLRFADAERRLLAEKGKPHGRKRLAKMASLVSPETILRRYLSAVSADAKDSVACSPSTSETLRESRGIENCHCGVAVAAIPMRIPHAGPCGSCTSWSIALRFRARALLVGTWARALRTRAPRSGTARAKRSLGVTLEAGKESHTMKRLVAAAIAAFALEACVDQRVLEPAAGAPLAQGRQNVAETAAAGVIVRVTGDSWKGDPPGLGILFTPVRVTIENHSGKTLRIGHRDFSLSGSSGFHYVAKAPIKAHGTLSGPGLTSAASQPHSALVYPPVDAWPAGVAYAPMYYDGFDAKWPEKLPTQEMLSQALPEGALADGGAIAGFVYFQSVTGRESAVEFEMTLVNEIDGQTFGRVTIPFQSTQR